MAMVEHTDGQPGVPTAAGGTGSGEVPVASSGPAVVVGLEFWSRQSDLWSGVFTEQQTGLLQMVRAQEAELRQGKRRISSLEQELAALDEKRKELAAAAAAAAAMENSFAKQGGKSGGNRGEKGHADRSLKESEVNDWRRRLDRMQAEHEGRLSAVREREAAVQAAELRVEGRARE
ncbi:unnamed protein product, partial [Ectocarpus fasciculatus]